MIKKYIIRGEDPNADYGGYHREPIIGYAEGEYDDVLTYARTLNGWFTWGSGGRLEEYVEKTFVKVDKDTIEVKLQMDKELKEKRIKLQKEKEDLEKRLKDINNQL